jgi:hypothetical protein
LFSLQRLRAVRLFLASRLDERPEDDNEEQDEEETDEERR